MTNQYYQLSVSLPEENLEDVWIEAELLGFDLTESGVGLGTSSLMNCGAWKGRLEELSAR